MRDRAGIFASFADFLTLMCLYYAVAGVLILGDGWGVPLLWLLVSALVCGAVFFPLLKKPRSTPLLVAVTGALMLASMGLYLAVSATPIRFGYVFVLAVGAGMAAGLPLYYALHRPKVHQHLTLLDVLIIALLFLLLTRDALGIGADAVALTTAVLFLDAAAAVGLRMSDGELSVDGGSAFKASMVALVSAAVLALVIVLFSLLFSRSGALTGSLLQGIGAFFAAIGGGIERFFRGLASLVRQDDQLDAIPLEGELPSLAESELENDTLSLSVNTTALGILLCALLLAAAVFVALRLRRRRFARSSGETVSASAAAVRRTGGTAGILWQRLRERLRFRRIAFANRDTPAGLFVILERRGHRARTPRQTGETMREFITRTAPGGELDELSDALDIQFYGSGDCALDARRCRELRRTIRRLTITAEE